ncbi:MAG: alpha/beta hydrolase [Luteococcus japonicus]
MQPVDVVAEIAPRPLLIVHGTHDHVIPVEHAHRLADAAGDGCELRIVDGVDHCGAYFADRPGYIERAAGFLGL